MIARFVVVRYGDLNRGEFMNVGLLAWDEPDQGARRNGRVPANTPVLVRMLKDWKRVRTAFPKPPDFEADVINRVTGIKTLKDYEDLKQRMGPYTPFEFSDERPSTEKAEKMLGGLVEFYLVEPT